MAQTVIGSLVVDLVLNSAAFIADMAKSAAGVNANTRRIAKDLEGLRKNFLTVSKVAAGIFAGDFGIRAVRQLRELVNESLELAQAMGGTLGAAAIETEEKLTNLKEAFQFGVAQGFLESFGDALDQISQDKLDKLTEAGKALGDALGKALQLAANAAAEAPSKFQQFKDSLSPIGAELNKVKDVVDGVDASLRSAASAAMGWVSSWFDAPNFPEILDVNGKPVGQVIKESGDAAEEAAPKIEQYNAAWRMMDWKTSVEGIDTWNEAVRTGQQVLEQTNSPLDTYRAKLLELQRLAEEQAPGAQRMAQAHVQAAAVMASSYAQVASNIGTSLTQLFEGNKGVAIASAIINTLQGITQALTLPFPLNWAQAAAVSIAGFAQVRQIQATKPGTGGPKSANVPSSASSAKASSGGGGGSSSSAESSLTQSVFITLNGTMFSKEQVRNLIGQINEEVGDGAVLRAA
jgi:hypothetical protein